MGKIKINFEVIDEAIGKLEEANDNIDFITVTLQVMVENIENNKLFEIENDVKEKINNLLFYIENDYREKIETIVDNLNNISDNFEEQDKVNQKGILWA